MIHVMFFVTKRIHPPLKPFDSRAVIFDRGKFNAAIQRRRYSHFIIEIIFADCLDMEAGGPCIFTIGHSNRTIEDFIALLKGNHIDRILDIRTIPRSRHNPQFAQEALSESLSAAGIGYTYLPALGGRRRPRKDSQNTGWRNVSFRGYADHMQSPEFARAIDAVIEMARVERCALMCAEAVPWRCHRSMVADAMLVRGFQVEDILGAGSRRKRNLTPFAHVAGTQITYPPADEAVR